MHRRVLSFCMRDMNRSWIKYLLLVVIGLAFCGGTLVGLRLGTDIGIAKYHNERMRHIQSRLGTLVRHLEAENLTQSTFLAETTRDLAAVAADEAKFYELLNSDGFGEAEQVPGAVGVPPQHRQ